MKKNLLKLITICVGLILFTTQCSKDELGAINGVVKIDASGIAPGAVVYLSTTPNAANIIATTIADSAGKYLFSNLEKGKYFVSAIYNTKNTNLLKSGEIDIVFKTATDLEVGIDGEGVTKDLSVVSDVSDGGMVIDLTVADWTLDATHSSVGFNFAYDSLNADFYGHFSSFELPTCKFDESNPANTAFTVELDMTSVETGASSAYGGHGRDGVTGCIAKSLGVTFVDTTGMTQVQKDAYIDSYGAFTTAAITNNTNIATFEVVAGNVEAYGNGYVAHGTLTFKGSSADTDFYFQYLEGFEAVKNSVNYKYVSLAGFMKINPKSDFGVSSGHVKGAPITITASIQFVKNLGAAQ